MIEAKLMFCSVSGVTNTYTFGLVSFTNRAIDLIAKRGCYIYARHPIRESRRWGIADGAAIAAATYHRTTWKRADDRNESKPFISEDHEPLIRIMELSTRSSIRSILCSCFEPLAPTER